MKKVLALFFVAILGVGGFFVYKYLDEEKNAWKIEITSSYINVRQDHDMYQAKLGEVAIGEVYKVLDFYSEDPRYVWYKIEIKKDLLGWVSSGRNEPNVKEYNNPNGIDTYEVDYANPIIRFYDEEYVIYDINSINYNHLEITDDSEYKITHQVYREEEPVDRPGPQYWIKYIVTDSFGNTTSKVQRIIFTVEPNKSEVLDFNELKKK